MKIAQFSKYYTPGLIAIASAVELPLHSEIQSDYAAFIIRCGPHRRSIDYDRLMLLTEYEMLDLITELARDIKWTVAQYEF